MIEYRRRKDHDITVVFDGWKGGEGKESHTKRGCVRIIYSRLGEKADNVIKRIISAERHEWIVVSSDREIANHAWAINSTPVPSETFLNFIEGEGSDEEKFQQEGDGVCYGSQGKSSQNKLSKKEKAIKRALNKL